MGKWPDFCEEGYSVTLHEEARTYEDAEEGCHGEVDILADNVFEETMEDVVSQYGDHSWIEWSCSQPETQSDPAKAHPDGYQGYKPWLSSEGEIDWYSGGAVTHYYTLFVTRNDGYPLSQAEYRFLNHHLLI